MNIVEQEIFDSGGFDFHRISDQERLECEEVMRRAFLASEERVKLHRQKANSSSD